MLQRLRLLLLRDLDLEDFLVLVLAKGILSSVDAHVRIGLSKALDDLPDAFPLSEALAVDLVDKTEQAATFVGEFEAVRVELVNEICRDLHESNEEMLLA